MLPSCVTTCIGRATLFGDSNDPDSVVAAMIAQPNVMRLKEEMGTEQAVRVAPRLDVRQRAYAYAPIERRHYFAQLHAYQIMPEEELLSVELVRLAMPVQALVSRPVRTACARCGEEIINLREAMVDGQSYCLACTYGSYYVPEAAQPGVPLPAAAGVKEELALPLAAVTSLLRR
jgi:ribosomal protein L37E